MSSRWRKVITRIFGRGQPDVYSAVKDYAEKKGVRVDDVVASACAAYLSADEEGKDELEKAMSEHRSSGGGGVGIKPAISMFKEVCDAMGGMFDAMNKARANMSVSSLLSDFKAVTTTMEEMKKAGSESGKGSIEDIFAEALINKIFESAGRVKPSIPSKKKAGKAHGKVEEVSEGEEVTEKED